MYETIDSIQSGGAPWKTYKFRYTGPKPLPLPRWMEETYELNVRDILIVMEGQLNTPEFKDQFDPRPYQEFDPQGNRVFSNLMSGDWAYRQAVCSFCFFVAKGLSPDQPLLRLPSQMTPVLTARCWSLLLLAVTKRPFR